MIFNLKTLTDESQYKHRRIPGHGNNDIKVLYRGNGATPRVRALNSIPKDFLVECEALCLACILGQLKTVRNDFIDAAIEKGIDISTDILDAAIHNLEQHIWNAV